MNSQDRISQAALYVGLCPLIPLPFVDSYVAGIVRRRLYRQLAAERGVSLGDEALETLSEEPFSLVGCLWTVVVWPIKKFVKYALIVLIIKECLDWATELVHRAQMLGLALDRGALPDRAGDVRRAMDGSFAKFSHSPMARIFWRQDRPPVPDLRGDYPLVRVAGWLHRSGGGGLMVPDFDRRLREALRPAEE